MTTDMGKRWSHTEDFKRDAVALVAEQGYKHSESARSPGIAGKLIRRWKRELDEEASSERLSFDDCEELKRPQKEVCMLRM